MAWAVIASTPIAEPNLDRWVTLVRPTVAGAVQYSLRYVPTDPIGLNWTRLGFYYFGVNVEGVIVHGPTLSLASPVISGTVATGYFSGDWISQPLLTSGKALTFFGALSVHRWVGPGTFSLLALT